ncbi:HAD family phosphatase, partial [Phocaeicola vulgatus]
MREHFRKEEKYNKNNYRGFSMESAVFFAIWYFIDLHHLPFTIKCLPLQRINKK